MAEKKDSNKKGKQLSIEEYAKIKAGVAKSRLKLQFPLIIKFCFLFPLAFLIFLIIYYLLYLRFLAEH